MIRSIAWDGLLTLALVSTAVGALDLVDARFDRNLAHYERSDLQLSGIRRVGVGLVLVIVALMVRFL